MFNVDLHSFPPSTAVHRQRFLGQQCGQLSSGKFSTETRALPRPQGCEIVRSRRLRLRTQRCQSGAGRRKGGRVYGHRTEFSGDPIDHRALEHAAVGHTLFQRTAN
jgi:hypothetical protein